MKLWIEKFKGLEKRKNKKKKNNLHQRLIIEFYKKKQILIFFFNFKQRTIKKITKSSIIQIILINQFLLNLQEY